MNARSQRKIVEPAALAQRLREPRAAGRTVVHCHGCFDLVHPGHVRYLESARQLGDILVVSLTGDSNISKGPDRPYIPQELRAENLAALEFVDWVVIDPHPTACELLELLKPDVYVKGREYATSDDPRFRREREIVERGGGRIVFHSGDVVFSSTAIIRSLASDGDLEACRLRALCRRHEITPASIRGAIDRFAGARVLVVGDVIRECDVACEATETAGDAPMLALRKIGATAHWGGAAGMALQLRALGASVVLVAHGGGDDATRALADRLDELGVEHHLPALRAALPQRTTMVADDTKLVRIDDGAASPPDSVRERELAGVIGASLHASSALVWCEHGYGMITPGLARTVNAAAGHSGVLRAGHAPGPRGELARLNGCDLVLASERRLRESLSDMGSSLPAVAWNALALTEARRILVGLHKRGILGFEGGGDHERLRSEFIPSLAAHHRDLCGAEEASLAVATLALLTGVDLAHAAYLAAAADALAVTRPGRTIVELDELRAWAASRPELRDEGHFVADPAAIERKAADDSAAERLAAAV